MTCGEAFITLGHVVHGDMRRVRWERKTDIGLSEFGIALDASHWIFGIYYENSVRELNLLFGPLSIWSCQQIDTERFWPSGSFLHWRWGAYKLRIDWSTHQFLLGYSRRAWDHSLYFGPIDVQMDYVGRSADVGGGLVATEDAAWKRHAGEASCRLTDVFAHWRNQHVAWFERCRIDLDLLGNDDGWAEIVNDTFQAIEAASAGHRKFELRFIQIKEKLGSLRIYFRRAVGSDADTRIAAIIDRARDLSLITCHLCGQHGSIGSERGRVEVRCYACRTLNGSR